MRQRIYDQDDGRGLPPAGPDALEPYGSVPAPAETAVSLPEAAPAEAQPRPKTPNVRRRARREKRSPAQRRNVRRFALLLSLILLLTATGVLLRGGVDLSPPAVWGDVWDRLVPSAPWSGYYDDYYEGDDWLSALPDTDLPRAPTGDGTVLTLSPAGANALTAGEIYDQVAPSVVGIRASDQTGTYLGSGIIMSSDGYIITNAHVIAGTSSATVILTDNSRAAALLVGCDGATDLAVLKIDGHDLPAAQFGDSAALRVGDPAYAIGNPLGEELRGTMTDGIISAIDRTVATDGGDMTLIQTTAALNSGNSGGALVNAAGQVVGVTNMKMMSDWETIEGLGFAIPSALVKEVVDQLIATGSYAGKPRLGVTVSDHFDADGRPDGARVLSVQRAADAYGKLWAGDVIVSANGEAVTCTDDLLRIKDRLSVGGELTLLVRLNVSGFPVREVTVRLMSAADLEGSAESTAQRGLP